MFLLPWPVARRMQAIPPKPKTGLLFQFSNPNHRIIHPADVFPVIQSNHISVSQPIRKKDSPSLAFSDTGISFNVFLPY